MTYIFLGPSLPILEAEQILDAHYLPPVKLGEVLTLVREKKPKVIGIIDGYFMQTLPVWHKEILFALEKEVIVLGASSMGALRAAETDVFGMIGVGKVYEMYRSGTLTDDDEVALIHAPREHHYLNLSLPMVNIRCTLIRAAENGLISKATCNNWIEIAKSLYYPKRTVEEIALAGHLLQEEEELITHIFTAHYVDQKKEDAKELLKKIASEQLKPSHVKVSVHQNSLFQQLFSQDRACQYHTSQLDPSSMTYRDLANYITLHHPDFTTLRRHALNRILVSVLTEIFAIQVEATEIEEEKERFKFKYNLTLHHSFEAWLQENHLTETEFDQLMLERAQAQKLYSSPLSANPNWRLQKAILDELKLHDHYTSWVQKAEDHHEKWQKKNPYYLENTDDDIFSPTLIQEHIQNSEWDLDIPIKKWSEEAGFHHLQELMLELHKAKLARD